MKVFLTFCLFTILFKNLDLISKKSTKLRILNFEIKSNFNLDNDLNWTTDTLQLPDTETIASLKWQFINRRLTELTQLATSPVWESVFKDCTKLNLFKHLQFESVLNNFDLSDNSVSLYFIRFND